MGNAAYILSVVFGAIAAIFELLLITRAVLRMMRQGNTAVYAYLRMITEPAIMPIRALLDRFFRVGRFSVDPSLALTAALMVFMRYFFMTA